MNLDYQYWRCSVSGDRATSSVCSRTIVSYTQTYQYSVWLITYSAASGASSGDDKRNQPINIWQTKVFNCYLNNSLSVIWWSNSEDFETEAGLAAHENARSPILDRITGLTYSNQHVGLSQAWTSILYGGYSWNVCVRYGGAWPVRTRRQPICVINFQFDSQPCSVWRQYWCDMVAYCDAWP